MEKNSISHVPSSEIRQDLAAGILAQRMGLRVDQFVAATNVNNVVPDFLNERNSKAHFLSVATISK